jgi:XTP/dITP diphosphohydrolase
LALPKKIVLASGNAGKLREIERILADLDVEIIAQAELGVSEADETGHTFVENALIKARHAAVSTSLPAIADDSGLVVKVLDGRPGVHSARYSGPSATDDENIDKLLQEMQRVPTDERGAAFHCCACFVTPDDTSSLIAEGRWEGSGRTGAGAKERAQSQGQGIDRPRRDDAAALHVIAQCPSSHRCPFTCTCPGA